MPCLLFTSNYWGCICRVAEGIDEKLLKNYLKQLKPLIKSHEIYHWLNDAYCIFWRSRLIKRYSGSTGDLGFYTLNETETSKSNPMKQNSVNCPKFQMFKFLLN